MARSVSIPAGTYPAGVYPSGNPAAGTGGWSLDGIARTNTDWIEMKIPTANLPMGQNTPILRVTVLWTDADGPAGGVQAVFNGGPWPDRQGQLLAFLSMRVSVPKTPEGKRAVTGGRAWIEAAVPVTLIAGGSFLAGAG